MDFKPAHTTTRAKEGLAVIAVDRWYRGSSSSSYVNLHFVYDGGIDGHDCSDLEIGTDWIVFATGATNQVLEMFDDCEGALKVSPLLGPDTSDGFLAQIEEDFAAGLNDSDVDLRITSIQRLAALNQLRSTQALHHVIATGSEEESKWAIFAELKAGDSSDLPLAVPLLLNMHHEKARVHHEPNGFTYTETFPCPQPECSMVEAISKLRVPEAIPSLTRLANEAPDDFVRDCANKALREIKKLNNQPQE